MFFLEGERELRLDGAFVVVVVGAAADSTTSPSSSSSSSVDPISSHTLVGDFTRFFLGSATFRFSLPVSRSGLLGREGEAVGVAEGDLDRLSPEDGGTLRESP